MQNPRTPCPRKARAQWTVTLRVQRSAGGESLQALSARRPSDGFVDDGGIIDPRQITEVSSYACVASQEVTSDLGSSEVVVLGRRWIPRCRKYLITWFVGLLPLRLWRSWQTGQTAMKELCCVQGVCSEWQSVHKA